MHFLKMHENIPKIAVMMLVTCDLVCALGASAINSQKSDIKPYESMITEYFKDHEVTEKQARESLRLMKEDEFKPPAHCRPCTKEQKQYCNSEFLLKDHCCCNQSHKKGKRPMTTPTNFNFNASLFMLEIYADDDSIVVVFSLKIERAH